MKVVHGSLDKSKVPPFYNHIIFQGHPRQRGASDRHPHRELRREVAVLALAQAGHDRARRTGLLRIRQRRERDELSALPERFQSDFCFSGPPSRPRRRVLL